MDGASKKEAAADLTRAEEAAEVRAVLVEIVGAETTAAESVGAEKTDDELIAIEAETVAFVAKVLEARVATRIAEEVREPEADVGKTPSVKKGLKEEDAIPISGTQEKAASVDSNVSVVFSAALALITIAFVCAVVGIGGVASVFTIISSVIEEFSRNSLG